MTYGVCRCAGKTYGNDVTVGPHFPNLWQVASFMSIHGTLRKRTVALVFRSLSRADGVLQGNALLGCHFASGVSGSANGCLRWSASTSGRHESWASKLYSPMVRGLSTDRDDEGSHASKELRPQDGPAGRDSSTEGNRLIEPQDKPSSGQSPDHDVLKSSSQEEHDTQQERAAEQKLVHPSCNDQSTEDAHQGQQQRDTDDSSSTGMVCLSFFYAAAPGASTTELAKQLNSAHVATLLGAGFRHCCTCLRGSCYRHKQAGPSQRWRRDSKKTFSVCQVGFDAAGGRQKYTS